MSGLWSFSNAGHEGVRKTRVVEEALCAEGMLLNEIINETDRIEMRGIDVDTEADVEKLFGKLRSMFGGDDNAAEVTSPPPSATKSDPSPSGEDEDDDDDGHINRIRNLIHGGGDEGGGVTDAAAVIDDPFHSIRQLMQVPNSCEPTDGTGLPLPEVGSSDIYDPRLYPALFTAQFAASEASRKSTVVTLPAAYDYEEIISNKKSKQSDIQKPDWSRPPLSEPVTPLKNADNSSNTTSELCTPQGEHMKSTEFLVGAALNSKSPLQIENRPAKGGTSLNRSRQGALRELRTTKDTTQSTHRNVIPATSTSIDDFTTQLSGDWSEYDQVRSKRPRSRRGKVARPLPTMSESLENFVQTKEKMAVSIDPPPEPTSNPATNDPDDGPVDDPNTDTDLVESIVVTLRKQIADSLTAAATNDDDPLQISSMQQSHEQSSDSFIPTSADVMDLTSDCLLQDGEDVVVDSLHEFVASKPPYQPLQHDAKIHPDPIPFIEVAKTEVTISEAEATPSGAEDLEPTSPTTVVMIKEDIDSCKESITSPSPVTASAEYSLEVSDVSDIDNCLTLSEQSEVSPAIKERPLEGCDRSFAAFTLPETRKQTPPVSEIPNNKVDDEPCTWRQCTASVVCSEIANKKEPLVGDTTNEVDNKSDPNLSPVIDEQKPSSAIDRVLRTLRMRQQTTNDVIAEDITNSLPNTTRRRHRAHLSYANSLSGSSCVSSSASSRSDVVSVSSSRTSTHSTALKTKQRTSISEKVISPPRSPIPECDSTTSGSTMKSSFKKTIKNKTSKSKRVVISDDASIFSLSTASEQTAPSISALSNTTTSVSSFAESSQSRILQRVEARQRLQEIYRQNELTKQQAAEEHHRKLAAAQEAEKKRLREEKKIQTQAEARLRQEKKLRRKQLLDNVKKANEFRKKNLLLKYGLRPWLQYRKVYRHEHKLVVIHDNNRIVKTQWKLFRGNVRRWQQVHLVRHIFRCISLYRMLLSCLKRSFLRRWFGIVANNKLDLRLAEKFSSRSLSTVAFQRWKTRFRAVVARKRISDTQKADELLQIHTTRHYKLMFGKWRNKTSDKIRNRERLLVRERLLNSFKHIVQPP